MQNGRNGSSTILSNAASILNKENHRRALVMRIWRIKGSWLAAGFALVIGVGLIALIPVSAGHVEIRGKLSPKDIADIRRLHQTNCPTLWAKSYPTWLPSAPRKELSAMLNPIEIIAAPSESKVIVVYRGFNTYYYDQKGKHRWGHASYALIKEQNGWKIQRP